MRVTGFLLAFSLLLGAARIHAQESIEVPSECGNAREFWREVSARLGENAPPPSVRVRIAQEAERYHLAVHVGEETREFDDADCRELFRVAVVVTAAMSVSQTHERHEAAPVVTARPRVSGPPLLETEPKQASPSAPALPWRFGVGAATGVNFGMAPQPVLDAELEARAVKDWYGVATRLRYRSAGTVQDENQRGVRVSGAGAQLALLVRPHRVFEASLGASLYRLSGTGLGSVLSQREDTAWSAGPALGFSLIPLDRRGTWVGVGGELYLDLIRPEFEILNYNAVFRVPALSGSIFLRIGHVFR